MIRDSMHQLRRAIGRGEAAPERSPLSPEAVESLREKARAAQDRREWASASEMWQQVASEVPQDINAWLQLGNMRNEVADYPAALTCFRRAGSLDTTSFDAVAGTAGVYERAGQWHDARVSWQAAIELLRDDENSERAVHAYAHALLSAHHANDLEAARHLGMLAATRVPGLFEKPQYRHLKAKLLKVDQPRQAKQILAELMRDDERDDAAAFDFASLCLDDSDYQAGLAAIDRCVALKPDEPSFLWLAADLHERLRQWNDVLALCGRMAALSRPEPRALHRGLDVAARLGDLAAARRFARSFTTAMAGELESIDRLRSAYEQAGETRRARLLCRWLVRRWPHSDWHYGQLIVLTAATKGLVAADRLVLAFNARGGRLQHVDRAYCEAAFRANEYAEAQRRLTWYLSQGENANKDAGAQVLLGYVKANAAGLAAAERHFLDLAARTYQSHEALVGLAHMASRRRDLRATLDLWAKIAALYPDDSIAHVEYARGCYNIGDADRALRLARARLQAVPSDVTMGEFLAWLMVATGDYCAARDYLPELKRYGGASWAGLETSIHVAGQLGTIDADWGEIKSFIPRASTFEGARHVYHAVRLLHHFERGDLADDFLASTNITPEKMPWLAPYQKTGAMTISATVSRPAEVTWRRIAHHVTDAPARRLDRMTKEDVHAALRKPRHDHPTIHIVNKFEQARGGSELHAIDLAIRLAQHAKVELWAPEMPHPEFVNTYNVEAVDHSKGRAPVGGVMVFIGVYFPINWIAPTNPERIVFLYNTFEAPMLFARVEEAFALTGVQPEILFCSNIMAEECGLPGLFEPSPIDIELFTRKPERAPQLFTVGRHSRDVVEKHHIQDGAIYQAVAEMGGRSIILGGQCMRSLFGTIPDLDLRPSQTNGIVEFLHGLDAYVYRTSTWVEPWGRVVTEAMACEVPVLVHDVGGYAQLIKHEENGLLFHRTEEATRLVKRLSQEPELRQRLGKAGRSTIESLLGSDSMAKLALFYLLRT